MSRKVRHAIVVCHPSPDSFTMAVAQRYADAIETHGGQATLRDLYRLGFDPVLREEERHGMSGSDAADEFELLVGVDVIVLVYPIWFGTPPAMLKGYVDRVFGAGRALGGERRGTGSSPLEGKTLVSLTLSGSSSAWLHERGVLMSLRNLFERYLSEVFGLPESHSYHFDGISPGMSDKDARYHLAAVDNAAKATLAHVRREWQREPLRN
jgi:NAD(P)H dehydrogenase (quinone)